MNEKVEETDRVFDVEYFPYDGQRINEKEIF